MKKTFKNANLYNVYFSNGFFTHQGTVRLIKVEAKAEVARLAKAKQGSGLWCWYA